ncbi:MAG TPA: peptidoglycan-binding protein [Polyangiaceae bacterium]|nr:peptidoglycan-binding protein [Polyangiaceae bacterium]
MDRDSIAEATDTTIRLKFHVAPTQTDGKNTLRQPLLPRACWRMDDHQFDFGSSFLMPECAEEFPALCVARPPETGDAPAKGLLLAVFGHADATGDDDQNKKISGRRATALYGLLVRDPAMWEKLYSEPVGVDRWGVRQVQIMLMHLGLAVAPTGKEDQATKQALVNFQSENGLGQTGKADAATRAKLFEGYMDVLCVDAEGKPFRYRKKDFLDRGEDGGGKAAYQGCGEFNPALVLSKKTSSALKDNAEKRNLANRGNRRVLVYMFDPSVRFKLTRWPCPRASEGAGDCRKMFWSDGDERRSPSDRERQSRMDGRTFACRWYDGIARFTDCEGVRQTVTVWLLDDNHKRMPGAPFRAAVGKATIVSYADGEGRATLSNVLPPGTCMLEWGGAEGVYTHRTTIVLHFDDDADDEHTDAESLIRLYNLGYRKPNVAENIAEFQRDYELPVKPWPDSNTKKALWNAHALGGEGNIKAPPPADDTPPFFEPIELHPHELVAMHATDEPIYDTSGIDDDEELEAWTQQRAAHIDALLAGVETEDEE